MFIFKIFSGGYSHGNLKYICEARYKLCDRNVLDPSFFILSPVHMIIYIVNHRVLVGKCS